MLRFKPPTVALKVPFSRAHRQTEELLAEIKKYYSRSKRGELSVREKLRLMMAQGEMSRRLIVTEITADPTNDRFIAQMAGKDVVHKLGAETPNDLREMRLSDHRQTKTAYALVDPISREVFAAIYVYRSDSPKRKGMDLEDWLPGHVGKILKEMPRKTTGTPNAYVFYSISRFNKMDGEGEMLIEKLHEKLNEDIALRYPTVRQDEIIFSTLSPFRTFENWIGHQEGLDLGGEGALLTAAYNYITSDQSDLPKDARDLVRRFHMTNGAKLLSIREAANDEDSLDSRDGRNVMVHYGYPRNRRELSKNASKFGKGKIVVDPALEARINAMQHPASALKIA
ncbi:MAG: hypothetical protein AAF549_01405 [Pseudomonadota bacterium]